MRLALSPKDCERLGCPESLELDLQSMTNREAVLLQGLGFPSVAALGRRLAPSGDDNVMDYAAWDAFVWLALRRAGIDVDVHTFEYDAFNIRILADDMPEPLPGPPDDPGKAGGQGASTSSPKKTSTTSRTSRRRSTSTG